jgi:Protein of unknown function (DUF2846)
MTKQIIVVIAALAGIVGCSSMPSGPKFSAIAKKPELGETALYIYRPDAYYGKAITVPVLINGKKVADIGNQGFFVLPVKPAEYSIQPDTDSIDHQFKFTATSGENVFLRLKVNRKPALCFCTSLEFEQVDQARASTELALTRQETDRVYGL